jgi:hypothetical protein
MRAMPGIGFAERYVVARESNVVRVNFTAGPDPPAPQFPGAGARCGLVRGGDDVAPALVLPRAWLGST